MSPGRRVALVLAACACLVLGAVVAAFATGLSLDLSRWRDTAAQQLSSALGRPVSLQGAVQLSLGRQLRLRVGKLHIANPPGFSAEHFAAVGDVVVRIDLLDLLRGRLRLGGVEARDIDLRLERASDGRGNWSFASPHQPASPPSAPDLGALKLQGLVLRFDDRRAHTQRSFELDEVSGSVRPNDPLRLLLRGRLDYEHAYQLRLEGAALQALQGSSQPWPFRLELKSSAAWLQALGTLDAHQGEARFHLSAGADDLAVAARLLGANWPQLGGATFSASIVANAEEIVLSELQGLFGGAAFSGRLSGSRTAARPLLSGALNIDLLDLRPFLQSAAQPATQPAQPAQDAAAWQALSFRELLPADLDLELSVGRALGLPVTLQDAKLALRADRRGVHAPLTATLAGAALTARFDLDLVAPTPTLAFRLDASEIALDGLAGELTELQGLEGRLERAAVRIDGRGDTPASVLSDLEASLEVAAARVSYRHAAAARPIAITLDMLQLKAERGEPLRGSAQGSLLGQPTRLTLRAGTLPEMLRQRAARLDLRLAQDRAALRVQAVFGPGQAARETALGFDLQAGSAGALAPWLPVAAQAELPLALRGQLRVSPDAWSLHQTTLELGRSRVQVDARSTRGSGRPLTTARVRSTLIDVPQLSTLFHGARAPASPGLQLDAPIFADAVDLADADLDLAVQQLWLGRTELVDLVMVASTREGRLLPTAMTGRLAGSPFKAQGEFDASGEQPTAKLDLSTRDIDVGALLRTLGVAEGIEARADSLQLVLQARGNSFRELATHTSLQARLVGGHLNLPGAAQRPAAEIVLKEALIDAPAGQPVQLDLNGTIEQTPVRLRLSSGSFADFVGDTTRVPFALAAQAAGTRLSLDGEATLPLGSAGQLSFEMSGQRLDSLNQLARVELPPWGPWSLRGPMRMTPTGYELQGLTLDVGQSRLSGSGSLDLSGARPRAELRVSAPSIQLDDFPMPQRLTDPVEPSVQGDGMRGTASRTAARVDRLLSARFLRRFDATIDVHAGEVLAGADRLADGAFQLQLREGRLDLDRAVLNLPGGGMRLAMSYDLKQSEVDFKVAARIDRFDYGIIARRLNRADNLRGLFSMNLALSGRAPSLDSTMRYANGMLDIAVWPTELRSGVFNLWSANLVLALLPLIDPGQQSQVNCIVGRFDLKDGDLSDDQFLIDTGTVRIRGTGHANLRTEELAFVFRPRAKGAGLFRLQTPLRVSGTLSDQRFGVDPRDVFFSTLRMIASPILVPIERLRLGPLPRDGADVCTDPLRTMAR